MEPQVLQKMRADLEAYRASKKQVAPTTGGGDINADLEAYRASKGKNAPNMSTPNGPAYAPPPIAAEPPQRNMLQKVGDFLAPTATKSVEKLAAGEKLGLRDVAGSALEIGSFLIPAGAVARAGGIGLKGLKTLSLAQKAGLGAATGAASGAAQEAGRATGEEGTTFGDIASRAAGGAALGAVGGGLLPVVGAGIGRAGNLLKSKTVQSTNPLEVAGKVVQGSTREAEIAARTLSRINTTGVKTYSELSSRLGTELQGKLKQVESEFAADTTKRKLSELTQIVQGGAGSRSLTGKVNYVSDALSQLGELYKKTKDLPSALRIKALTQQAKKEGLNPTEINELAKEYGRNFRSKGFSKTGEPLTSVNDQAFENTRSGLKETARGFLKNDAARTADKEASDLIKTKELTDKMVEKVNKLSQRIEERNIIQKIARRAGQALDIVTMGGPKAFVTKLLFPSGVGEKQLTSLDIQDLLAKNLKLLQRIEKAPDSAVPTLLQELFSSLRN